MTKIHSLNEVADITGVSRRAIEREIEDGRGPVITQLTPRRVGIAHSDLEDWLASRRVTLATRRPGRPARDSAAAGAQ